MRDARKTFSLTEPTETQRRAEDVLFFCEKQYILSLCASVISSEAPHGARDKRARDAFSSTGMNHVVIVIEKRGGTKKWWITERNTIVCM
jgi:hypothetical protein